MKRAALYEKAERMRVAMQMTYEEIARDLDISDRTVRTWADEGRWDEKRAAYVEQQSSLDERMYRFLHSLMDDVEAKQKAKEPVDVGRLYVISRLADKLEKARRYEGTVAKEKAPAGERGGLSEETMREIERLAGLS